MSLIHPTAIVEEGAEIAPDVTIGPFCHIGSNVRIGTQTVIHSHAVISGHTTIGKRNRIYHHAVIGTDPQDLKYRGEPSKLVIGDENIIREFTHFNPGTQGGGMVTKVGDKNLFMAYVHVGHDVRVGDGCILANAATLGGHVQLGDFSVIGGLSGVHQFVKIGAYAMLAAGSLLTQDLPPYCMAEGTRAYLRGLNVNGLRRKMSRQDIDMLKQAYKRLFLSCKPLKEEAKILYNETQNEHVKHLCDFINHTSRGIPYKREYGTKG